MIAFRILSVLIFSAASIDDSYAQEKLQGCWNDIKKISVNPSFSPTHESTTASGTIICFKHGGVINTVDVGGFEALGSSGRFTYKSGQLKVVEDEVSDGWVFAHKTDRCEASVVDHQLKIARCKEWNKSRVIVLRRQIASPDLNGVAAGVFP